MRLESKPTTGKDNTELALSNDAALFNWYLKGRHCFSRSLPRTETIQADPEVAQTANISGLPLLPRFLSENYPSYLPYTPKA